MRSSKWLCGAQELPVILRCSPAEIQALRDKRMLPPPFLIIGGRGYWRRSQLIRIRFADREPKNEPVTTRGILAYTQGQKLRPGG